MEERVRYTASCYFIYGRTYQIHASIRKVLTLSNITNLIQAKISQKIYLNWGCCEKKRKKKSCSNSTKQGNLPKALQA